MSIKVLRQFTPFYCYTGVGLFLGVAAALSKGPSRSEISILLVLGFLSWCLVEYVLHRFIFHLDGRLISGRKFVYAAHSSHHENPKETEDLFTSMRVSGPLAAAYWLLAWAALGSWRSASYLFIGLIAGYFCYEWLHFQAHHRRSRLPLLRYLKKYHLLHHYRTPGLRFGVTSPLIDLLFGTFRPVTDASSALKSARRARISPLSSRTALHKK